MCVCVCVCVCVCEGVYGGGMGGCAGDRDLVHTQWGYGWMCWR